MPQEKYLKEFEEITMKMLETTRRKNTDYTGGNEDAFKNFTMVEDVTGGVISTERGMFTRITDKFMRIASFVKKGTLEVADETVEDTLIDMAIYCIIFVIYRRRQKSNEQF